MTSELGSFVQAIMSCDLEASLGPDSWVHCLLWLRRSATATNAAWPTARPERSKKLVVPDHRDLKRYHLTNPTHVTSGVGRLYFLSAVCGMLVGLVAGNNNFTNRAISTHFDTVSNPGEGVAAGGGREGAAPPLL